MNASMEQRLRAVHARVLARRCEIRQRRHAGGVWFRLRRFLTFAAEAFIVSDEEAQRLIAEGFVPDPAGMELEPPKTLIQIPRSRLAGLSTLRSIPIAIGPEFLAARAVVTVGFESEPSPPR